MVSDGPRTGNRLPMKRKPHSRRGFVGHAPRIVLTDPYYTVAELTQIVVGVVGVFALVVAIVDGAEFTVPSLTVGVVFLAVYSVAELTLSRAEPLRGRLATSGGSVPDAVCRLHHHSFRPDGTTTTDGAGLSHREQPPQMTWTCARCGERRRLEPGVSPD